MRRTCATLLFLATLIAPLSPLRAGEGVPVINGVYPFAGVFMTGHDRPVVSFHNKDGFAMLGATLVDNLSPSWGFEATVAFVPDKNDSIFFLYHGNLITNLRITNRVYPYLTVGAGAITQHDSLATETNLAMNGGIGVKLRMTSSAHLRIDFRDYAYFLPNDVQHWQSLVIGAGYSFDSVLFEW